jgi:hypothetical protein
LKTVVRKDLWVRVPRPPLPVTCYFALSHRPPIPRETEVVVNGLSTLNTPNAGCPVAQSRLVETMREIGGAVGIAVVPTVLVARTRDATQFAGAEGSGRSALEGFQSAFMVIVVVAVLGALVAGVAFPRLPEGSQVDEDQAPLGVSPAAALSSNE